MFNDGWEKGGPVRNFRITHIKNQSVQLLSESGTVSVITLSKEDLIKLINHAKDIAKERNRKKKS